MALPKPQPFKKLATLTERGRYNHFDIHPKIAPLYGYKAEDIVEVLCTPLEEPEEGCYHGWMDEDGSFSGHFIWSSKAQVQICFPYGFEIKEAEGKGKYYPLRVEATQEAPCTPIK